MYYLYNDLNTKGVCPYNPNSTIGDYYCDGLRKCSSAGKCVGDARIKNAGYKTAFNQDGICPSSNDPYYRIGSFFCDGLLYCV